MSAALATAPRTDDVYTFEDLCRLVPDGQKADLLDGVIYVASPDMLHANELTQFLSSLTGMYATARRAGRVVVNRYAFELTDLYSPEPDVAFVSGERDHVLQERAGQGAPDLTIEVVSKESRDRDYGIKKRTYEAAGVREYWVVDHLQSRVEFHRLQGDRYQLVPLERNRLFRSEALPGFWLDVEWLLRKPLPDAYDCLQQILAGDPPA
jgi:Uma2 family endonuclease